MLPVWATFLAPIFSFYCCAEAEPLFLRSGLTLCIGQPGLWSSYLWFPMELGWQVVTPPCPAIGWDGVFQTFFSGWPGTPILLISTSRVTRIIGVSHCAWPSLLKFLLKGRALLGAIVSWGQGSSGGETKWYYLHTGCPQLVREEMPKLCKLLLLYPPALVWAPFRYSCVTTLHRLQYLCPSASKQACQW
jgi:hypothetical protein